MQFDIKSKKNPNLTNYHQSELDIAYKFAAKAYKEFGAFLKAVVLFGSTARNRPAAPGEAPEPPPDPRKADIDLLIIIDDTQNVISQDMIEAYRIITEKMIVTISKRLHITTLKFTSFWEYVRSGDPIAINILRDGIPLIDSGFYAPLQVLLYQGRIRPTKEAIYSYFTKAPRSLLSSRMHINSAVLDLYWAVIDSAHATLMTAGEIPPSPAHVSDALRNKFGNKIDKRFLSIMNEFYKVSKMILHREIKEIKGDHYERYYAEAREFVDEMKRIIEEYNKSQHT
ncbi:hypothetical protein K9M79_00295 [Candidatus Woesearchaeota archaeon]|nr:hypothetical protein [Candidatus Woesearchaeota archaeon]